MCYGIFVQISTKSMYTFCGDIRIKSGKYLVAEKCTSCNWLTSLRQPQRKREIHFHKISFRFCKAECTMKYCIDSPFMCSILYCKAAHYFAIHKRIADKFNSHIFFHIWQKSTTALHCKHCTALHHSEILLRSPFIFSLPKSSVSQTNHFVYDFSVPAAQNHLGNEL